MLNLEQTPRNDLRTVAQTETNTPSLILASASPRRQHLLSLAGLTPTILPAEVDETQQAGESPHQLARRLARAKAHAVSEAGSQGIILAADTIVMDGETVLGKPANPNEAIDMLMSLRGRTHCVATALAVVDSAQGREVVDLCETRVRMRSYRREEVLDYVASGSPLDKAGAYGIQDGEFRPVTRDGIEGCFANVMGLPLCRALAVLSSCGLQVPRDVTAQCWDSDGNCNCVIPGLLGMDG